MGLLFVLGYLIVGGCIAGFLAGKHDWDDEALVLGGAATTIFWPLVLVGLAILIPARWAYRQGEKQGR